MTSAIGASTPMAAYPGSSPISTVATPISSSVLTSTCLRPSLSPSRPKKMPPTGRARNPTAYVENDSSVPVSGSLSGKNSLGKTRAAAAE
jgi:hypothetical protein